MYVFRFSYYLIAAVILTFTFTSCDLLNVENPNSLQEEELDNPQASRAMANGLQSTVTRALGYMYAPYGMSTDELTWVGSRDAWQELDFGDIDNELNEFSDLAYPYVAEAEWTSREYIGRMEGFQEDGTLPDERPLVRAYLYGAIINASMADIFENYAPGDKREAGEPIGEQNMNQLYDKALEYINKGLSLDAGFKVELSAMKARVLFSRGIWEKVNPRGDVDTDNPLVANQEAANAAQDALSLMDPDFKYELPISPDGNFDSYVAGQVNERLEMRVGDTYVEATEDDKKVDEVIFKDPIDDVVHPYTQDIIMSRYSGNQDNYEDITIVSAREMHLILAEHELATGGDFETHINNLRQVDELSDYTGQIPEVEMLETSRQANLFFQGRRLADQYRFGTASPEWLQSSSTLNEPGTFFPITITEINANPNL